MSITFDAIARYELLTVLLVALLAFLLHGFERNWGERAESVMARAFAGWRGPAVTVLLALVLRGALMFVLATPQPQVHDEFSYLLNGDTFAHRELTNPTPASWQHFETFHENMVPTYHSKYPIAQGVALAVGEFGFRNPWIGVYLSTALMCGAVCWALQAFVTAGWAMFGGVLCVLRMAVFGYWMNSYWGGSVTAIGGALVLGAGARVLQGDRRARMFTWFSIGLMTLFFSRPLEGFLFCLPVLLAVCWRVIREGGWRRAVGASAMVIAPGLLFFCYYNWRTTGNPLLMPYFLYERAYASTPLFLLMKFSQIPQYRHAAMADYYQRWLDHAALYSSPENLLGFEKMKFSLWWNFYAGWVLTVPIVVGIWKCWKSATGKVVLGSFVLPLIVYAAILAFHPHYVAAMLVSVFVLAVVGWRTMWESRMRWVRALAGGFAVAALLFAVREPVSNIYMFRGVTTRLTVSELLRRIPGQHLVMVKFLPGHVSDNDIVFNSAEFRSQKVLWAREMPGQDAELCRTYPNRKLWLLETDDKNVSLNPSSLCDASMGSR